MLFRVELQDIYINAYGDKMFRQCIAIDCHLVITLIWYTVNVNIECVSIELVQFIII